MNNNLRKIKQSTINLLAVICPTVLERLRYQRTYHSCCDLDNPQTFSEKLLWLKKNVYWDNPLIQTVGDKYLVRDYLHRLGYDDILNELFFVWEDESDIDWEQLPTQFVIKLSVGCGTNLICSDKSKLDIGKAKVQLAQWMHPGYFRGKRRFDGKPHKEVIVCEKYLGLSDGTTPIDYKFYCFSGKPQAVLVIDNRFSNNKTGVFMSPDWNLISDVGETKRARYQKMLSIPDRPKALPYMVKVAQTLSKPFPFVRIDLYEIDGKVYFGEFTMFPHDCIGVAETNIDGRMMGELLDISYPLQWEEH